VHWDCAGRSRRRLCSGVAIGLYIELYFTNICGSTTLMKKRKIIKVMQVVQCNAQWPGGNGGPSEGPTVESVFLLSDTE